MKRYALFSGHNYYPEGGWEDFRGSYDTPEEALAGPTYDWWHVVDLATGCIVASGFE